MEGIDVPMTRGSMNDITEEVDGVGPSQTQDNSTVDSLSTQGARLIYEREAHITVDYSHLDDDYKDVCSSSSNSSSSSSSSSTQGARQICESTHTETHHCQLDMLI